MAMAGACLTGYEAMALPRAVRPPLRYKARRAIEWFGRQSAAGKKTLSPHGLGAPELNSSEWASFSRSDRRS